METNVLLIRVSRPRRYNGDVDSRQTIKNMYQHFRPSKTRILHAVENMCSYYCSQSDNALAVRQQVVLQAKRHLQVLSIAYRKVRHPSLSDIYQECCTLLGVFHAIHNRSQYDLR